MKTNNQLKKLLLVATVAAAGTVGVVTNNVHADTQVVKDTPTQPASVLTSEQKLTNDAENAQSVNDTSLKLRVLPNQS